MSAAEKSHDHVRLTPFLSALPISSFAMVMGLSGLALVWGRVANLGWLPGLAGGVALGLSLLVGLTFAVLLALYIRKWARNHQQVYEEWQHPVKSSFFAAVSVSFALVATVASVSYTHFRAHETVLDFLCRRPLEKKQHIQIYDHTTLH